MVHAEAPSRGGEAVWGVTRSFGPWGATLLIDFLGFSAVSGGESARIEMLEHTTNDVYIGSSPSMIMRLAEWLWNVLRLALGTVRQAIEELSRMWSWRLCELGMTWVLDIANVSVASLWYSGGHGQMCIVLRCSTNWG